MQIVAVRNLRATYKKVNTINKKYRKGPEAYGFNRVADGRGNYIFIMTNLYGFCPVALSLEGLPIK